MRGRPPVKPGQWRKGATYHIDPAIMARLKLYADKYFKGNRSAAVEYILDKETHVE